MIVPQEPAIRVTLAFVVALYPTKLLLSALRMTGGKHTGSVQLPTEAATLPWWQPGRCVVDQIAGSQLRMTRSAVRSRLVHFPVERT